MTAPFVFITTHCVDSAALPELRQLMEEYHQLLREQEPGLLAHCAYFDDAGTEVSLVQIHRDADSAEHHMQVAGGLIGKGVSLARTLRVQVYGKPGPRVNQALLANREQGVDVYVAACGGLGFSRLADPAHTPTTTAC